MSSKNKKFIIAFIVINLIYIVFLLGNKILTSDNGNMPVISFDEDVITVSVKSKEKTLLEGVVASDVEDGDISDDIFIYSISTFDENNERTITYAVFDSDDQLVTASRKLKYKDYTPPKFKASQPLFNLSMNSNDDTSYISATSSVDGNISNKVSVSRVENDNKVIYKYNVTDSTGTTSTIEVTDEFSFNGLYSNIDIILDEYIIYVDKGTELDTRKYIDSVETSLGEQNELIYAIDVETNYNKDEEGIYEVKYTLNRSNGDYGISKLIVVVE